MLKIKDDVDLKKLEKYGFLTNGITYFIDHKNGEITTSLSVDLDDREIWIQNDNYDLDYAGTIPNELYDLINDGLVEKI